MAWLWHAMWLTISLSCCRHNFDAAMTQQRAEIEKLHSTMATLRQERDRVIMVGSVGWHQHWWR